MFLSTLITRNICNNYVQHATPSMCLTCVNCQMVLWTFMASLWISYLKNRIIMFVLDLRTQNVKWKKKMLTFSCMHVHISSTCINITVHLFFVFFVWYFWLFWNCSELHMYAIAYVDRHTCICTYLFYTIKFYEISIFFY